MLRPAALQSALQALVDAREIPADVGLLVLGDCGSIYAQAHGQGAASQDCSSSSNSSSTKDAGVAPTIRAPLTEIQRQQLDHQPGLTALMPSISTTSKQSSNTYKAGTNGQSLGTSDYDQYPASMPLCLSLDERARVIAGVGCQAWTEEMARIRRLRSSVQGRFSMGHGNGMGAGASSVGRSLSGSSSALENVVKFTPRLQQGVHAALQGNGGGITGRDDDDVVEYVKDPVAIVGARIPSDDGEERTAPLMLETELGTILVMPLPNRTSSTMSATTASLGLAAEAPLLLVLASYPSMAAPMTQSASTDAAAGTQTDSTPSTSLPALGSSILSQEQWNALHDGAQSFAEFVSPALRQAFGDARVAHDLPDGDDVHVLGSTTGIDGANGGLAIGPTGPGAGLGAGAGAGGSGSGHDGGLAMRKLRGRGDGTGPGTDTRASTTIFSDDRDSAASAGRGGHDNTTGTFF